MSGSVVWFRRDLRVGDNPALQAAVERGGPVIPLFIWSDEEEAEWPTGSCSKWWLHHSLSRLQETCAELGSPLVVREGASESVLDEVLKETGADAIFWNRRYESVIRKRDEQIKSNLASRGLTVASFNGSLLVEPWEVLTKQGTPYQVFTPFWRACQESRQQVAPLPAPTRLTASELPLRSESIDSLSFLPRIPWDAEFPKHWTPGEAGARAAMDGFLTRAVKDYSQGRNIPSQKATSRLSPHLHFGEISPRQIEEELKQRGLSASQEGVKTFVSELGWREFAHSIMFHFPHTENEALRDSFHSFPWVENAEHLERWQRGQTGYPIVDAGMRELWTTGWMHNRVRMIVGSFLTKDLLIDWKEGARWFWDTLVDADLANNQLGWQWVSGCGADAAPYFRVFNPITQGTKFDPDGTYVRRWCPELADLPNKWIHAPWTAPDKVLRQANVELGGNYPEPIVDHAEARKAALNAFASIKKS
ncbi:MAG: deoxyribodipyrimidine photo-lyase [Planctomycetaceae bacterium]|nr:deoxyribodipyrimidine photo-lyase [Planctomycetaceae bacterium]